MSTDTFVSYNLTESCSNRQKPEMLIHVVSCLAAPTADKHLALNFNSAHIEKLVLI